MRPEVLAWVVATAVRYDAVLVWTGRYGYRQALLLPRSLWRRRSA